MKYMQLSDGSILFRAIPPIGFYFKNYQQVPGNPHHYKPVYAFECQYRVITELRSPCGRHIVGYDTICSLDQKGTSFGQCNSCVPQEKRERIIELGMLKAYAPKIESIKQEPEELVSNGPSEDVVKEFARDLALLKEVENAKQLIEAESTQHLSTNQSVRCEVGKGSRILGQDTTN